MPSSESSRKPVVALISATPVAIPPAQAAIGAAFDEVDVWNILDDRLMVEAQARGGLTEALSARMGTLIDFAIGQGADAVLLTCSLYGPVAERHVDGPVRVLAPDRAVFDDVLARGYGRVLVVASFTEAQADSAQRLREAAALQELDVTVTGVSVPDAMSSSASGDVAQLIDDLATAVQPLVAGIDAVLLAQYSLAPARDELEQRLGVPVLSGPASAAALLRSELSTPRPGERQ